MFSYAFFDLSGKTKFTWRSTTWARCVDDLYQRSIPATGAHGLPESIGSEEVVQIVAAAASTGAPLGSVVGRRRNCGFSLWSWSTWAMNVRTNGLFASLWAMCGWACSSRGGFHWYHGPCPPRWRRRRRVQPAAAAPPWPAHAARRSINSLSSSSSPSFLPWPWLAATAAAPPSVTIVISNSAFFLAGHSLLGPLGRLAWVYILTFTF
jgi:hypothetical protein